MHTVAVVFAWVSILSIRDPFSIILGASCLGFLSSHHWRHRKKLVWLVLLGLVFGVVSKILLSSLCDLYPDLHSSWPKFYEFFGVSCTSNSFLFHFSFPILAIFCLYRSMANPLDLSLYCPETEDEVSPIAFKIEKFLLPLLRPCLIILLFFIGVQRASVPALLYVIVALWLVYSDSVFTELKRAKTFTFCLYVLNCSVLISQSIFQLSFFSESSDLFSISSILGLDQYHSYYSALKLSASLLDFIVHGISSSLDVLVYSASFKRYLSSVKTSRDLAIQRVLDDEKLSKLRRERILKQQLTEKEATESRLEMLKSKRLGKRDTSARQIFEEEIKAHQDVLSDLSSSAEEIKKDHDDLSGQEKSSDVDVSTDQKLDEEVTPDQDDTSEPQPSFLLRMATKLQSIILNFFNINISDLPPRHQTSPLRWLKHNIYRYSSVLSCLLCYLAALWFPSIPTVMIAFTTITFGLMSKYGGKARFWQFILGIYLSLLLIHYIFTFPFFCFCVSPSDSITISFGKSCLDPTKCPVPRELIDPSSHPSALSSQLIYLVGIAPIGSFLFSYPPLLIAALGIVLHRSISFRMGRWGIDVEERVGVRQVWGRVVVFFKTLMEKRFDAIGVDLYPFMFFIDILQLIALPFAFFSSSTASQSVIQSVQLSYLPGFLAIWLIVQFLLIIIDRTLFYLRFARLKALIHFISNFTVLIVFCLIFPRSNHELPINAPFLLVAAFLRFVAAVLSSLQLRFGFPPPSSKAFLMKSYGSFNNYGYQAFRVIPFLYEMKCLLDWSLTTTALEFNYWMRIEDIYSSLFLIKCRRLSTAKRGRNFGDPQPKFDKFSQGFLLFFGLTLLLCLPLILFSSANPVSKPNPIQQASIDVSFNNYLPIFSQHEVHKVDVIPATQYNAIVSHHSLLRDSNRADVRKITFFTSSDSVWTIAPPAMNGLVEALEDGRGIVSVTLSFNRHYPSDRRTAKGWYSFNLDHEHCLELAKLFSGDLEEVTIPLLPRAALIPLAESPIFSDQREDTLIQRRERDGQTYWLIKDADSREPFYMYTYSLESTAALGAYASGGLIGLYLSIVIGVGRFVRLSFSDSKSQIFVSALPNVDKLLEICEDLFLARSISDLFLEESIYKEIIQIYRDPDTLIELTTPPVK
ncbi:hypothetical protein P9112_013269 [Eukaryota sp. TZLM1-RC]